LFEDIEDIIDKQGSFWRSFNWVHIKISILERTLIRNI
jgi:hypothetical protein